MRSSWKILPINPIFYRKKYFIKIKKNIFLKFWIKDIKIFSNLLEKKINVYNGINFISLSIKKEMLGKNLGEFILTKKITSDIHLNKKIKK